MEQETSVLIVDDDESLCKSMAMILRHKGYDVSIAMDGTKAIEMVTQRPFDMVFLDIKMPFMDGVEAHRRIKSIRPDAVVMMMTAFSVDDMIKQALREGAYGIMYKPLDMAQVIDIVEKARSSGEGMMVLIIDDDPSTCTTLKNILVKMKYRVEVANTGEEAIAAAKMDNHDVLIIDMKLPTINGLETYLAIKEIRPETVAIIMTAYRQEMSELVDQALKSSAYTCLYKPIDMDQLLDIINRIRGGQRKAN
jgi:two-component system response regulator HydG